MVSLILFSIFSISSIKLFLFFLLNFVYKYMLNLELKDTESHFYYFLNGSFKTNKKYFNNLFS